VGEQGDTGVNRFLVVFPQEAGRFGKRGTFRSIHVGTGRFKKGTASGHVSCAGGPGARIAEGVFSCPDLAAAESLCSTVLHCSILFLFGKNCPNID
jgi:hypothetical protein